MGYPPPPQYYGYRPPPQYTPGEYQQAQASRGGSGGGGGAAAGGGALGTLGSAYGVWKMADPFLPYEYTTDGVIWDRITGKTPPSSATPTTSSPTSSAPSGNVSSVGTGAGVPAMSSLGASYANAFTPAAYGTAGYGSAAEMLASSQGGAYTPAGSTLSQYQTVGSSAGNQGTTAMSSWGQAVPYVQMAIGTYQLADMYSNRPKNRGSAVTSGASGGATLGAGIGSLFGPMGTAIGGGIGAVAGGAYGAALGVKNKTNREQMRNWRLAKSGYKYITDADMKDKKNPQIRTDLAPDFQGYDKEGKYVNNRFANSRKESDLTPETILNRTQGVGGAGFAKEFGNAWMERLTEDQRKALIQESLNRGLVTEKLGSTYLNADQELKRKALYMMNGIKA